MIGLDHPDSGEHLVHPREHLRDAGETLLVDLADAAAEDVDRQHHQRHADQQNHHQRVAVVLLAGHQHRRETGDDLNRRAGEVGDGIRDRVFDGRSVVGATADQMTDIHVAEETHRLVDQFAEDLLTQVGHHLGAHPAGAVVVDVGGGVFDHPGQDEDQHVNREDLPRDPPVRADRLKGEVHRPVDLDLAALHLVGEVVALRRFLRLAEDLRQLRILLLRIDHRLDCGGLLRLGEAGFLQRPEDLAGETRRRRLRLDGASGPGGIDHPDQLRNHQQTDEERPADRHAGEDADGQAQPVRPRIPEKPEVTLRFEIALVFTYSPHADS